jgi:hypothetical protein
MYCHDPDKMIFELIKSDYISIYNEKIDNFNEFFYNKKTDKKQKSIFC